jgi:hypothetical protein
MLKVSFLPDLLLPHPCGAGRGRVFQGKKKVLINSSEGLTLQTRAVTWMACGVRSLSMTFLTPKPAMAIMASLEIGA